MRYILKIIRFDLLTVSTLSVGDFVFVVLFCLLLSLLLSPMIAAMISFCVFGFVYPLQGIADRNGFDKLYGTLPVSRRSVPRARFLYIFAVFFICEAIELVIVSAAVLLNLNKLLFANVSLLRRSSAVLTFLQQGYAHPAYVFLTVFAVAVVCCIVLAYLEMTGQIHGRENQLRSIVIGILALAAVFGVAHLLSEYTSLIPKYTLSQTVESLSGVSVGEAAAFGAGVNIAMFAVCMIFGEITAAVVSRREI